MELTIVIVNWNGGRLVMRCLDSIRAHASARDVAVIVVDNDSTDGSREEATAAFPEFRVINSGGNLGFAKGNNLARTLVDTPLVLFLNPDTELMDGSLDRAMQCLRQRPDVGAVGCKMLDVGGHVTATSRALACARIESRHRITSRPPFQLTITIVSSMSRSAGQCRPRLLTRTSDPSHDARDPFTNRDAQSAQASAAALIATLICLAGGRPVAGLVVSTVGQTGIYLLAATGDAGLNARGSYLLQWRAIQRLKELGRDWYDLGGVNQEANPGVFTFKAGMGGEEVCQLGRYERSGARLSRLSVSVGEGVTRVVRRVAGAR